MTEFPEDQNAKQEVFSTRWEELERYPERTEPTQIDMNNFFCNVSMAPGYRRADYASVQALQEKHRQFFGRATEMEGFSLKRLDDTNQAFFDEIDAVIEDLGIKRQEIERLVVERAAKSEEAQKALDTLLLPVYKALRKRGYSHRDLVG